MDGSTVATRYWHRTGDGRVQCDVCPRACKLHEGQRGLCFVRARAARRDGADHLRPLQRLLHRPDREEAAEPFPARARRCSRSARPGCNLTCRFCQNWDISKARETDTLSRRGVAAGRSPRGRGPAGLPVGGVHLQRPGHLPGIRGRRGRRLPRGGAQDGGGDRRLHLPRSRAAEFFRAHRRRQRGPEGVHRATFYRNLCGGQLAACWIRWSVLRHETGVWLEITTLLIPGENDADAETRRAGQLGGGRARRRTCRCISPRSIRTARCATRRPRRRRR